jgi:hypothetical protein
VRFKSDFSPSVTLALRRTNCSLLSTSLRTRASFFDALS